MHRHPRIHHLVCIMFVLLLVPLTGPLSGFGEEPKPPTSPRLRERIDALVAALSTGDAVTYERFAQDQFAPSALARRTPEDRRRFLDRFHGDFGKIEVVSVERIGEWAAEVVIKGNGQLTAKLRVDLEAAAPHRFTSLGVSVEQGDDQPKRLLAPLPDLSALSTEEALAAALDPYLEHLAADGTLSGAVLVAHHGRPLYTRAYGLAEEQRKIRNTPSTRFNLASIGKLFTKVAIGQLLAQGKLALDDPIAKHLARYPNQDAARKVTIRQLLDHRAGVVDIFKVERKPGRAPQSNREWFDRVASEPLEFEPGTQMRYCNGCYVVLGEIVAAVSGLPYETYLARQVFAPAGMTSTAFLGSGEVEPGKAVSYTRSPGGLLARSELGGRGSGAGGVFSTAADLLAFDNALRGYRLLDRERTAWLIGGDTAGERATGSMSIAGGAPGISTALVSDATWTVIVLTNRDPRTGEELGVALAKALNG